LVLLTAALLSAGCATAVDPSAPLQGASAGIFLGVFSLDGVPVAGTATATVSEGAESGTGYSEVIDTAGYVFLPLTPGDWDVTIRDEDGVLLDCDPIPSNFSEGTGIVNASVTCNTGVPQP
jgi:hypothetical protein